MTVPYDSVARAAAAACVALRDLGFAACWYPGPAGSAMVVADGYGPVAAEFKIWLDGRDIVSLADNLAGDDVEEIRAAVRLACPVEPQQQRVWRRIVAALDTEHKRAPRQGLQLDRWGAA